MAGDREIVEVLNQLSLEFNVEGVPILGVSMGRCLTFLFRPSSLHVLGAGS